MIQQKRVYPESGVVPSAYCKYFFRCEQSSGEIDNLVSGGSDAVKTSGFLDATLWANDGYANLGGGAANYCTLDAATHDLTLAGYSVIVTARVLKSAAAFPGAEQYFISSYAPGSNTGGIIIACRTDGSAKLYVNSTDGTTVGVTSAANVLTNGSAATEQSLVFGFPRESGVSAVCAVNGIPSSTSPASTIAGKSLAGGRTMRIGGAQNGAVIDGYRVAAFAAYMVPADLSDIRLSAVYEWAWRNPAAPIPEWVFE